MNRIDTITRSLIAGRNKALGLFLTAGYPKRDSTTDLVSALEKGGADFVELGMPFSDPLADGPVIQQSSAKALENGVTLETIFHDIRRIRRSSAIPIVLMGYLNPILRYGEEKFFRDAAEVGVDGVILPEVSMEESARFVPQFDRNGLAQIMLVTPASDGERISEIDRRSSGFLYCVSSTGVTGSRSKVDPAEYLTYVRRHASKNAMLVGFGIASPDDARIFGPLADGVIIGSALLRLLGSGASADDVSDWVRQCKRALVAAP